MIAGQLSVTLTPELRQLALNHVYLTEQGAERDDLVSWFQEWETPDGYVLDAAREQNEAWMITVIARAMLWEYERCVECGTLRAVADQHEPTCSYLVR